MEAGPFDTTPGRLVERVLRRRGCPLHYWTSTPPAAPDGGPTLVFLHGAFMDHRMFNLQVAAFAEQYRLLLLDSRGQSLSRPFGQPSMMTDLAEDVIAVLDAAGVDRPVLVGQSMGAYIAQHVVRLNPTLAAGLVLIGCTPISFPVPPVEMAALRASTRLMGAWPLLHLRRLTARSTARETATQRYAYEQMSRHGRDDVIRVWAVVASAVRTTGFDLAPTFPVLLMHGDADDRGTIHRDMTRWARENPHFRHTLVPNAGHNANQDNPGHVNRELAAFLEVIA